LRHINNYYIINYCFIEESINMQSHHHGHSHAHSHGHQHDTASQRIGWAFCLNAVFTVIDFIGGWLTNSTAIMADAVHDLGDRTVYPLRWRGA
jgi:cobalt-zinc-cadmium efflux system protein